MKLALALPIIALSACAAAPTAQERAPDSASSITWLAEGGIETSTLPSGLIVTRVDPHKSAIELVNPPESDSLSISQLAERNGYRVAINAAMFARDYVTSVGYMRNYEYVNNPKFHPKMSGFLMFNPKREKLPLVKAGSKGEIKNYQTAFQTYRMWDPEEGILWKKGRALYYHVALAGVDAKGRLLLFFHPSRVDVHDLVAQILELGLELKGLLYLDGDSHGSIYLDRDLGRSWNARIRLPNVIGVKP